MPKETINDLVECYDVQVAWAPGPAAYVQVGIETHDGRSVADWLSGDGQTPADFTGLWGTFDRDRVNRLIRVLRRARDSAFGADA